MHLSFQNIESENSESADRLNALNRELKVGEESCWDD